MTVSRRTKPPWVAARSTTWSAPVGWSREPAVAAEDEAVAAEDEAGAAEPGAGALIAAGPQAAGMRGAAREQTIQTAPDTRARFDMPSGRRPRPAGSVSRPVTQSEHGA
jgi:hypothetical protein